jgi:hypothetical protein
MTSPPEVSTPRLIQLTQYIIHTSPLNHEGKRQEFILPGGRRFFRPMPTDLEIL